MTENGSRHGRKQIQLLGCVSMVVVVVVASQFVIPASQLKDFRVAFQSTTDAVAFRNESAHLVPSSHQAPVTVDIVSIGSNTKVEYQDAQQRTFGSHPHVRNFVRITEDDDADPTCATTLTVDDIAHLVDYCKPPRPNDSFIQYEVRKWLFNPKRIVGWLCAQKRPVDGLYKVLSQYRQQGLDSLPDYVFVIDDDTYLNMDMLVDTVLLPTFPPHACSVTTGCVFQFLKQSQFKFPYGGFGSFFTKASIQRWLQPIDCSKPNTTTDPPVVNDPFARLACWRLQHNLLGEALYFRDGMSVADLMYQFSTRQPFSASPQWTVDMEANQTTRPPGYCLHSDHALGYFVDFYHIAVPQPKLDQMTTPNDDLRRMHSYQPVSTRHDRRGECQLERDKCNTSSTTHTLVCHYIEPLHMDALYHEVHMRLAVDTSKNVLDGLQRLESLSNTT